MGGGFTGKICLVSSGEISRVSSFIKGNLRISTGYNGDRFFAGFTYILDMTLPQPNGESDIMVNSFSGFFDFFAGYRI
ncbi:MAG: DUF4421 domain-containing protein [bacterium]|nr:DUF4421 domain-containing protein [bacterium]